MSFEKPSAGYDWRFDPEVVGVNALTLGLWVEVAHRWVGPASFVSAVAKVHHPVRCSSTGTSVTATVPDSVVVAGTLRCGASFSYHLSQSASFSPGHTIEIYGSRGALIYRLFSEEILGATGDAGELTPMVVSAGGRTLSNHRSRIYRRHTDGRHGFANLRRRAVLHGVLRSCCFVRTLRLGGPASPGATGDGLLGEALVKHGRQPLRRYALTGRRGDLFAQAPIHRKLS